MLTRGFPPYKLWQFFISTCYLSHYVSFQSFHYLLFLHISAFMLLDHAFHVSISSQFIYLFLWGVSIPCISCFLWLGLLFFKLIDGKWTNLSFIWKWMKGLFNHFGSNNPSRQMPWRWLSQRQWFPYLLTLFWCRCGWWCNHSKNHI